MVEPYKRAINALNMPDIESWDSKQIEGEFNRIGIASLNSTTVLNNLASTISRLRIIYIPFELGSSTITTSGIVEPFNFGDTQMFLEIFPTLGVGSLTNNVNIDILFLVTAFEFSISIAAAEANVKVGIQFKGMASPLFTPTKRITGTVNPQFSTSFLNLSQFVDFFRRGGISVGIGAWKTSGGGQVIVGDNNVTMTNPTFGLILGVR